MSFYFSGAWVSFFKDILRISLYISIVTDQMGLDEGRDQVTVQTVSVAHAEQPHPMRHFLLDDVVVLVDFGGLAIGACLRLHDVDS